MKRFWQNKRTLLTALVALFGVLVFSSSMLQAAPVELLANGDFSDGLTSWSFLVNSSANMNAEIVDGEVSAEILSPGSETYHIMLRQHYVPMVEGSTYTFSFDARASQPRSLFTKVGLSPDPYTAYGLLEANLTTDMQTFSHTFTMNEPSDPCAVVEIQMGGVQGDIVIDNISLTTEDNAVVPPPSGNYTTPSQTGNPLRAHAEQLGMKIGTAAGMTPLLCDATHSDVLSTEFNSITPENAMKMEALQPVQGEFVFGDADALVDYAEANDMQVHGHVLVWHSQTPGWITNQSLSREELIDIMYNHIDTVVGRYAGEIAIWDVVNEAIGDDSQFRQSVWYTGIGPDFIDLAFQRARQADPNAILLYNDYNIADLSSKSNATYNMVADMVDRGIPIDGVGFQMHWLEQSPPSVSAIASNMARYDALGLDVYVTEIDVRIQEPADVSELEDQAEIYANMLAACIQAPNCNDFTTWGLTDLYSWIPYTFSGYGSGHLFDEDYNAKPAYFAMIEEISGGTPPATSTPVAATSTPGGPTATATTPPTATATLPAGTGYCDVDLAVVNQWGNGFQADVTITNTGSSPIAGWELVTNFENGEQVTSAWNASVSQSGTTLTASNVASHWNGTIQPGGSVTFGMQGTHTGTVAAPSVYTVNGVMCGGEVATPTAEPPTPTSVPPTNTPVVPTVTTAPPTATAVPPTATSVPATATSVPPTATSVPATPTSVPPTATPGSGGTCSVDYDIVNQWADGFQVNVTIENTGISAVGGYTLSWDFVSGEQLNSGWNATYSQTGTTASASNSASQWNGTIQPNGSVSFGFVGAHNGTVTVPSAFDLNGMACN